MDIEGHNSGLTFDENIMPPWKKNIIQQLKTRDQIKDDNETNKNDQNVKDDTKYIDSKHFNSLIKQLEKAKLENIHKDTKIKEYETTLRTLKQPDTQVESAQLKSEMSILQLKLGHRLDDMKKMKEAYNIMKKAYADKFHENNKIKKESIRIQKINFELYTKWQDAMRQTEDLIDSKMVLILENNIMRTQLETNTTQK